MRLRPRTLDSFVGQPHLLLPNKPLFKAIQSGCLHSMILWGPPGTGKTTLAEIIASTSGANIERISAVLAGVKEIRAVVKTAAELLEQEDVATVLFVDEVHRFNKAQQDAFLPHVEAGTITLIGATTENPSFALNNALLSRARVYVLKTLTSQALASVIERALKDNENGYGQRTIEFDPVYREQLIQFVDGDARQCLNLLEILVDLSEQHGDVEVITEQSLKEVLTQGLRRFDNRGDMFFDQISALHKSVRGSDPDASLYWFCRMAEAGCDLAYLARRIVRIASEDIGNADPRALQLAINAWESYERLGSPEGELALAQAVIYLACAAKSNAVYTAYKAAMKAAREYGSLEVPMQLRNAPTALMKQLGCSKGYRYAHDEDDAFAAGECYFPAEVAVRDYYHPVSRGLEIKIADKLKRLKSKNNLGKSEKLC
jgi:putative ATPase